MKIFALLSWVLIFAFLSLLFQNITTYSLEIWVQRLKPKLCGMPSRPLGKYRKSTTIYHIFTTAYYVLYILYHNEAKGFIDFLYYFHCFFMITNCAKTWYAASKYFWTYFGIALRFPSASTSQPHQSIPNLHYWIL